MTSLKGYVVMFFMLISSAGGIAQDIESWLIGEQSPGAEERHDALIRLSRYYDSRQAWAKAIDYWTKCGALEKEMNREISDRTLFGLAESQFRAGLYGQAAGNYTIFLQRYADKRDSAIQYPAWIHYIMTLEKTANYEEGIRQYSLIIIRFNVAKNPTAFVSLLNHMGILEKKRNNPSYAFDYFTNARTVIQQHSSVIPIALQREVFLNLAVTHAARSEFITSLSWFQTAENLKPASANETANLLNLKGATYFLMGRFDDAQRAGLLAADMMVKDSQTLEEQITLSESYDLLSRLYRERDWPTYQQYHGQYLSEKEKINGIVQAGEESRLRQSIDIEKRESEIRARIASNERIANESRQRALEAESAKGTLELRVRDLEVRKQNEDLKRIQLEKQLLLRGQAEQQLLLDKQQLENESRQKELDRQELVQERARQELMLVRSQKQLADRELDDARQSTRYVIYIAVMAGVVFLLAMIVVFTLLRNRRRLIRGNRLIVQQKQEIEKQNGEIMESIKRLESAQETIESQNKKLTTYNETLAHTVAERTQQLVDINGELTQNNHQLEQYSYMTAHNLRGPIARLLGLTSIFGKLGTESHPEVIDKVQKEAGSLDTMIKDLNKILQVRKATEELSQIIDISKSVRQAIAVLDADIAESDTILSTDFTNAPSVFFVPTYFENIIYNLVSNSIKYRHPDRQLEISISSVEELEFVVLQVSDNGLGIDLERNRANLFGLYKRFHTHKDGKGIGLYLIKAQIETMGGTIQVQSKVNMGTRFTLNFPKKQDKKKEPLIETIKSKNP